MPLQTQNLVMVGLGVLNDQPPNRVQPRLVDGIHLRWAFRRDLGFPWYGSYLFRRPHSKGEPLCLSSVLSHLQAGPLPNNQLTTAYGQMTSDQDLILTDDFPPPGLLEFDLDNRRYLRFTLPSGETTWRVDVRIGFRKGRHVPPDTRECVRFSDRREEIGPTPLIAEGVKFEVRDANGNPYPQTRITHLGGPLTGLYCGFALEIDLPQASSFVDLTLTHHTSPVIIEAFNDDGSSAGIGQLQQGGNTPEQLTLTGRAIKKVLVRVPNNEAVLNEICFGNSTAPHSETTIQVTALLGDVPVGQTSVTGTAGQIISTSLEFDAISAIELSHGPAALVDVCFVPVSQNATHGWEPVPDCPEPICLPVTHPDYPCGRGAPTNLAADEALALGRVLYGPPGYWAGAHFAELHDRLLDLVVGGPGGTAMANRSFSIPGIPVPPDPGLQPPTMPNQYPLDLVLLGSLHAAVAQILGLYWVDRTAVPGVAYDYLIIADNSGRAQGNAEFMLRLLEQANFFNYFDGYIVFNKQVAPAPTLSAPTDLRVYALPGGSIRTQEGTIKDGTNNAGLHWDQGLSDLGLLLPGRALMYHVWRDSLGDEQVPPTPDNYDLITKEQPVLVIELNLPPGVTSQNADDWPSFPLHFLDIGLTDGWYSYKVNGIDIFGRHSPNSDAGSWYEWAPMPDPRPWYYMDPPGDTVIHLFAVRLLDKLPPPYPTGVEAFALDPADPMVLRDQAYNDWRATLSSAEQNTVIGLRVRWQWTEELERQAPDTREFRIYFKPGQLNALLGRTTTILVASSTESTVETDIPNTQPASAFAGTGLQIGANFFTVADSDATSPLSLRVKNIGTTYTTGTISVTNGAATVTGTGTNWGAELAGLSLQIMGEQAIYTILRINSPTQLTLNRVYAETTGTGKAYIIFDTRPRAQAPCTVAIPSVYTAGTISLVSGSPTVTGVGTNWSADFAGSTLRVAGDATTYTISSIDSPTQLTLNQNYTGSATTGNAYTIGHPHPLFTDYTMATNWQERYYVVGYNEHVTVTTDAVGRSLRKYEVFLPAPGDTFRGGLSMPTSLATPIVYAHIGVSAADDKIHTDDAPQWATGRWGGRFGNEGRVGPSATIFRVRREAPPPPAPPPDSERVFATPADYHDHSFYTYRWRPSANLKTHIFRALDDALFKADWALRPRPALVASQLEFFPDTAIEPRWNQAKREQVADELNHLNGIDHDAVATGQAMAYYQGLSNDGLRVLAGLPGNERAFTQLTIQPQDPGDPANADRRGPDSPDSYVPDPNLRAYVDTLDGRSQNRYFYRSIYVDRAHNRSSLSLSSPPVWLPKVVPPRAPVITKVLGGDRQIVLRWASNREPDLVEYRVYRADNEASARDVRLMALVHTEAVPAGDPATRPAEVVWTDTPVSGLVALYYRLVAMDSAGNVSEPSPAVSGRAYNYGPPIEPSWERTEWVKLDATGNEHAWDDTTPDLVPAVALVFTTPQSNILALVQRQNGSWHSVTPWQRNPILDASAGIWRFTFYDRTARSNESQRYRARLMSTAGVNLISTTERALPIP